MGPECKTNDTKDIKYLITQCVMYATFNKIMHACITRIIGPPSVLWKINFLILICQSFYLNNKPFSEKVAYVYNYI